MDLNNVPALRYPPPCPHFKMSALCTHLGLRMGLGIGGLRRRCLHLGDAGLEQDHDFGVVP